MTSLFLTMMSEGCSYNLFSLDKRRCNYKYEFINVNYSFLRIWPEKIFSVCYCWPKADNLELELGMTMKTARNINRK